MSPLGRREFLVGTAAVTALTQAGCTSTSSAIETRQAGGGFRTSLCDLLGIEYPILQSGMGGVAGPKLAAEVSRAGGLGILAGLGLTADELRRRIRQVRELTDRPFGVNLWLHTELRPPADVTRIPESTVRAVQGALNRFRQRLGLPETLARPAAFPDLIDAAFEVILEERVPVWSIGLGDPGSEMIRRCRERGVKVVAMVCTLDDARAVARSGVDVIVAQGGEAGGHRSTWIKGSSREAATIGTMALVPQIVDAVKVPVVAAGGIADGRGLVAAIALGASGILLGTRFVATQESEAPDFHRKAILERGSDATTVSDAFTASTPAGSETPSPRSTQRRGRPSSPLSSRHGRRATSSSRPLRSVIPSISRCRRGRVPASFMTCRVRLRSFRPRTGGPRCAAGALPAHPTGLGLA